MIKKVIGILLLQSILLIAQNANIHHNINVKISPEKSSIEVVDEIISSRDIERKIYFHFK